MHESDHKKGLIRLDNIEEKYDTKWRTANWRTCSLHLWKNHKIDVDMLTCPICLDYKSPTTVKMKQHLKVHSLSKSFVCGYCGKGFRQPTQLRNHKVIHMDKKVQSNRWYSKKKCEICSKTYADSKVLKKHIQAVHSKLRPFICHVCGHSTNRKMMLQMHLRQHTGEKPYNCTKCDYKTSDHNTLRKHLMRHSGERPYVCPYCAYTAIQSSAYKSHLITKHDGKPGLFQCTVCSFKTINAKSFVMHESDHKKGLIRLDNIEEKYDTKWTTANGPNAGIEVFPGNIAAARLVYSCLGEAEGPPVANVTQTSGNAQTITIQIPAREPEDDETQNCFLAMHQADTSEETIDTGGVTIPAQNPTS